MLNNEISIHKLCPQSVLKHSLVHFQGVAMKFQLKFRGTSSSCASCQPHDFKLVVFPCNPANFLCPYPQGLQDLPGLNSQLAIASGHQPRDFRWMAQRYLIKVARRTRVFDSDPTVARISAHPCASFKLPPTEYQESKASIKCPFHTSQYML